MNPTFPPRICDLLADGGTLDSISIVDQVGDACCSTHACHSNDVVTCPAVVVNH